MNRYVYHYVSNFLPLTEVWLYNLIRNHQQFDPIVLCRKTSHIESFPMANIFALQNLPLHQWMYNFAVFKIAGYFPYFERRPAQFPCHVLHTHFGYHAYKSIGLAKSMKRPLICSFYGGDVFKFPMESGNKAKYTKLFKAFAGGVVLGPYMKQSLVNLGCPEEKLIINHLGVEVDRIAFKRRDYPKDRPFRFLIAASFVEKKGIDVALRALHQLEKEADFTLEIVGDGPLKENLLSLISDLKMERKVVLHGYKPYRYFLNLAYECDAFLQASKTARDNDKEGTPMAIIDAMATGLPVVSTRHSDIPEIVDDGVTGFLAEENDVDSLSEAIRKLLHTGNEFHTLSDLGRKKIERDFDIHKQVSKLEQYYLAIH